MLQVSRLSKAYASQVIFEDASFSLTSGERVGLVGRNGHGKSTLFRIILGDEHADEGTIKTPKNYSIAHLSQHIHFTEPTVLEEGCLALPKREDYWIDESYRVEAILLGLGFSPADMQSSPQSLSGGFQVRLNLAKALVAEPNLLLLDEPTNYLDIVSVRWLERFLKRWPNEMIIITHDREFMDTVTTHTMGIHRHQVKKVAGPTHKYYSQLLLEEEIYEKTRRNDAKKRADIEAFVNRFRASAARASLVQSRVKLLNKLEVTDKLNDIKNLDFSFTAAPFTGKWPLEVEHLSFGYPGSPQLFNNLSFSVGKRDRIGIIGKNGRGKTTLLNLLAQEIKPDSGEVIHHPALSLGYFGQTNIDRLSPNKTVEEQILELVPSRSRAIARGIAGAMMFEGDLALKKISVLSGGERSRVLLGRILVTPANLLLLDEPTNHLDMESIDSLIAAIEVFSGAVIVVTHSELLLRALVTRLLIFDINERGESTAELFEGTYDDFLERRGWREEEEKMSAHRREQNSKKKDYKSQKQQVDTPASSKTAAANHKRIKKIEDKIVVLEEQIKSKTEAINAASISGDHELVNKLSWELRELQQQVELAWGQLESV